MVLQALLVLLEVMGLQEQVGKVDRLVVQLLLELLDLQVRQVLRVQVERQP
jgi:hypothetical protein